MLRRKELVEKLRTFFAEQEGVEFAYLFGSMATGRAYKLSDVDIAVMCRKSCDIMHLMTRLSQVLMFEEVDIVDLSRTNNLRLIKEIIQKGILLKDSPKREEWELQKYHLALDFINHAKVIYGY